MTNPHILAEISEAALQQTVGDMLAVYDWKWIHHRPGRRKGSGFVTAVSGNASKGWPDLFAVRGDEAIALELKSMRGRVSSEQTAWLERLNAAGIEAHVIRPTSLDWLEYRLKPSPTQLTITTSSSSVSWVQS